MTAALELKTAKKSAVVCTGIEIAFPNGCVLPAAFHFCRRNGARLESFTGLTTPD